MLFSCLFVRPPVLFVRTSARVKSTTSFRLRLHWYEYESEYEFPSTGSRWLVLVSVWTHPYNMELADELVKRSNVMVVGGQNVTEWECINFRCLMWIVLWTTVHVIQLFDDDFVVRARLRCSPCSTHLRLMSVKVRVILARSASRCTLTPATGSATKTKLVLSMTLTSTQGHPVTFRDATCRHRWRCSKFAKESSARRFHWTHWAWPLTSPLRSPTPLLSCTSVTTWRHVTWWKGKGQTMADGIAVRLTCRTTLTRVGSSLIWLVRPYAWRRQWKAAVVVDCLSTRRHWQPAVARARPPSTWAVYSDVAPRQREDESQLTTLLARPYVRQSDYRLHNPPVTDSSLQR